LEAVLVISAVATALSFPPVRAWWLLLVAPALWLWVLRQAVGRQRVWLGFGWGLLFAAVQSVWALPTLAQRAQAEWAAGIAWAILLGWYGCWCALFGWLMGLVKGSGSGWAVAAASTWVGVSWLRSVGSLGFPWAMLSLPLARFPLLLQPAELGGIWLVEWLLILWNALLAQGIEQRRGHVFVTPLILLGLWVGVSGWLWWWAGATVPSATMRVAVLQPEYDASRVAFSSTWYDANMERLLKEAHQAGAHWAVLPESSDLYCWSSLHDPERLKWWRQRARQWNLRLLIGVSRHGGEHGYNSALALAPEGAPTFYDKVKLMPFVERAPPPLLARWLRVLGAAQGPLREGQRAHALQLVKEPAVGAQICYECLFGWIGVQQVRDGAQWLAAMANDQWLLGQAVREQYADYCVVRAIEVRRWLVRASSVGPSGFFSPQGERWTLPMGRPQMAVRSIGCSSVQTLYARWGDYWGYGSWLIYVGVVAWLWRRQMLRVAAQPRPFIP
jgi:apolipoprotein N-acyltransferase